MRLAKVSAGAGHRPHTQQAQVGPHCGQVRRATAVFASKVEAAEASTAASPENNGTPSAKASPHDNVFDFDELSDIIRLVESTDIVELELKSKKFNLAVRKREALQAPEPVYQAYNGPPQQYYSPPPPPQAAAAAPAAAAPSAPAPAAAAPAPPAATGGVEIQSPMSGTFYRLPAPGEPPFAKEGDIVKKGQTVGIIEAMKLMNEIEAEISGEVIKFCAENGKSVSPGQVLLIIRPT